MNQIRFSLTVFFVLAVTSSAFAKVDATQLFYDGSIDRFGYNYFPNHKPLSQAEITDQNLRKLLADIKSGEAASLQEFHRASVIALRLRKPHLVRDAIGQVIDKKLGPKKSAYQVRGLSDDLFLGYAQAHGMVQTLILDDLSYRPTTPSLLARSDLLVLLGALDYDSTEKTLVQASSLIGKGDNLSAVRTLRKLSENNPSPHIGSFYVRANLSSPGNSDLAFALMQDLVARHPKDTRVLVLAASMHQWSDLSKAKSYARLAFKQKDLRKTESALMERILLKGRR